MLPRLRTLKTPDGDSEPGHDVGTRADAAELSNFVMRHTALVDRIALDIKLRVGASVELDDLIQAGRIGLIYAARRFKLGDEGGFADCAATRVREAMYDEIRGSDWAPRSLRRWVRAKDKVRSKIENATGSSARGQDIAAALHMTTDAYHHQLHRADYSQFQALDALTAPGFHQPSDAGFAEDSYPDYDDELLWRHELDSAVLTLSARERFVISLLYKKRFKLREIGATLGVSESRACQIHRQALQRLRARAGPALRSMLPAPTPD